ncbi:MAG: hypothetical protein ABSD28_13105 [Tepidisphaeraceae bacterium]|jgi:hypothetical protein
MPALTINKAAEELAKEVEKAGPSALAEIRAEFFPGGPLSAHPVASDIARHVRKGLEAEEIVDLWNVVFPGDRNVWYDEETKTIHFQRQMAGYAE